MCDLRYCLVLLLITAPQAVAETAPAPAVGPGPLSKIFPCDAFERQADGSWLPTRDVNIELPDKNVITVGPAVSFPSGKATEGPDIWSVIERECGSR